MVLSSIGWQQFLLYDSYKQEGANLQKLDTLNKYK